MESYSSDSNENEAYQRSLDEASGAADCKTHVGAGALFWFTIMTTVGYGNTAPTTLGGRGLIYTFGFLNIIAFTSLIGQAGYVTLVIFDRFCARRCWLRCLTGGLPAVLFWFSYLVLYILLFAVIAMNWSRERIAPLSETGLDLGAAFWFSYVHHNDYSWAWRSAHSA
jgi:hypothetical protein